MGAVFAAHHELLQQRVALKVMLAETADSVQAAARFLNEARAAAKIEGEHVARVLDVGQFDDGAPFIAMEFLDGADLSRVLADRGALSGKDAVDFMLQALEAIAQAHALGIVHRDLKPANLFLARRRDGSEIVKVLDFGISKAIDPLTGMSPKTLTRSSSLIGSPLYMAPEQLRSSKTADACTDVWAIGVILFELLAGKPPFDGETVAEVFVAILERPPAALGLLRPDLPPGLEAVVMRCLSRDRSQRFANVAELAIALAPFAPTHALSSVERVVRTMQRVSMPGANPTVGRASLPLHATTDRRLASAAPWSSTNGVARARRRGPLVIVASILIGGGLGSLGVARWIAGTRARVEPSPASASEDVRPKAIAAPSTLLAALPIDGLERDASASTRGASAPSTATVPKTPAVTHIPSVPGSASARDLFDTPR
jgi:serine/threonine-protein kinase